MSKVAQLEEIFTTAGLYDMYLQKRSMGYFIDPESWFNIVWNAGFRGFVEQLDDKVDEFKQAHLKEILPLCSDKGL